MRIAQIAPLTEAIPPKLYGGTERVISWLTVDQLTRALGEAAIWIWVTCLKACKFNYLKRRWHLKVKPSDRSLRFSCMTSIHAPRTHWASLATCRSPTVLGVRAFVRINIGKDA
jgi:hypothetical protein